MCFMDMLQGLNVNATNSSPCGGVPRTQKLKSPLVEAQGYQRFLPVQPGVGQNIEF